MHELQEALLTSMEDWGSDMMKGIANGFYERFVHD